jgi:hypothetical protein
MGPTMNQTPREQFVRESEKARRSFLRELWELLGHNKKWWMLPVMAVLLLVALLMVLSSTAVAPFIYSLF